MQNLIVIKGAGEMASAIAHRLVKCQFPVVMTEIEYPSVIRRSVSFAQAIFSNEHSLNGVCAKKINSQDIAEIKKLTKEQIIPVVTDPEAFIIKKLKPLVVIDAILAKVNLGTKIQDAPLVIGLGPGFTASQDVHFVIETNRGHNLGKIIDSGCSASNTKIPGNIGGYTIERVLRAPTEGIFLTNVTIGQIVAKQQSIGTVAKVPVFSQIAGIVRGVIINKYHCTKNMKIADIDPRSKIEYCYSISDKARNISGSVLELIVSQLNKNLGNSGK